MRAFLFIVISILFCCKPSARVQSESQGDKLQTLVEKEIGKSAVIEKNPSNTFALASHTENRTVDYVVIRLSDLKVVIKEKIIIGSVSWSGDRQIKVVSIPGMVRANARPEDNVRLIDLNNYVINKK